MGLQLLVTNLLTFRMNVQFSDIKKHFWVLGSTYFDSASNFGLRTVNRLTGFKWLRSIFDLFRPSRSEKIKSEIWDVCNNSLTCIISLINVYNHLHSEVSQICFEGGVAKTLYIPQASPRFFFSIVQMMSIF